MTFGIIQDSWGPMAIEGFSPPPSPYYQLLERGSARLGCIKKFDTSFESSNKEI